MMTLVFKLDLDVMVTHLHTINEVNKSNGTKDRIQNVLCGNTDRHTYMCKTFTYPLPRAIKIPDVDSNADFWYGSHTC